LDSWEKRDQRKKSFHALEIILGSAHMGLPTKTRKKAVGEGAPKSGEKKVSQRLRRSRTHTVIPGCVKGKGEEKEDHGNHSIGKKKGN